MRLETLDEVKARMEDLEPKVQCEHCKFSNATEFYNHQNQEKPTGYCYHCEKNFVISEEYFKELEAFNRAVQKEKEQEFVLPFNAIAQECYEISESKGFWERDKNNGEAIALMHSELSEALESLRHGNPKDSKCPDFLNVEIEFADCMIRVMEFCHKRGYRLSEAILEKMKYNLTRHYKHGKEF